MNGVFSGEGCDLTKMDRASILRRDQRGFTLVELLVVIAIIGVLAAIVIPNVFRAVEKAKISRSVADLKAIKAAALAYYADTGTFPPNDDDVAGAGPTAPGKRGIFFFQQSVNMSNGTIWNPSGWNGPYLEKWPQAQYWAGNHGGTYQWQGVYNYGSTPLDFNGDNKADPCIELNFGGSGFTDDQISAIMKNIDAALDDGNLATGMFRYRPTTNWPQHTAYYCVAYSN
ncbi:MAG: type II secretion system protein [Desulfotomaculales bacterium]